MIECQIVSACETDFRSLGIDSFSKVTTGLNWRMPGPDQTWLVSQGFSTDGTPLGAVIINKDKGTILHVPNNGNGNLVDLLPANTPLDPWSTWTFAGDRMVTGPWGNPLYGGNDAGYVAIRPLADSDLNLNVRGGCGNAGICVWGWSGGDRNEIWRLIPTGNGAPDYYRIQSKCGGYLACDAAHQKVVVMPGGDDMSRALWQVEIGFRGAGIYGAGAALGCVLTNVASGLFLNKDDHNENDGGLVLADSTLGLETWTFGPVGDWVAIRPGSDNDQNLNVKYGCDNTEVMLYPWGGGALNEVWRFTHPG